MKLQKQHNKTISQSQEIDRQSVTNETNQNLVNNANNIQQIIKRLGNLSTDWTTLEELVSERFAPPFSTAFTFSRSLGHEWRIDIGIVPKWVIPFIQGQILYRSPDNLINLADNDNDIDLYSGIVFQEEEIDTNTSFLTAIAKLVITNDPTASISSIGIDDIEAKFLLYIFNPNLFI